jgi:hypothetical protein
MLSRFAARACFSSETASSRCLAVSYRSTSPVYRSIWWGLVIYKQKISLLAGIFFLLVDLKRVERYPPQSPKNSIKSTGGCKSIVKGNT